MLTTLSYNDVKTGWDKSIADCCTQQNPSDPTCVECCYDTWQGELKTVTQQYNVVAEKATQIQSNLTFITDRRSRYKKWLDEINAAQDLATGICNQLELIAMQSDKIWYNSCKAVDAVNTLFCMIRDFFMQLDQLSTEYADIQNCIANNTDPSLVKGQGILKCLDDYKAKLDIVIKLRDAIIANMVNAITIANLIRNEISTKDCNIEGYKPCPPNPKPCAPSTNSTDIYYGFKTIICTWYNAFACDTPCNDSSSATTTTNDCNTNTGNTNKGNSNQVVSSCDDTNCELLPTFDFPICNTSYKACVQKWFAADDTAYNDLTTQLQEANKQKEALTACKNSLEKAIKTVDPKTRCN